MAGFLYHSLAKCADEFKDKTILVVDEKLNLSANKFLEEVERCASFLHHSGFKAGDVIFNALGNSLEFCVLLYAANGLDIITVPISTKLKLEGIKKLVQTLKPKYMFYDESYQDFVPEILSYDACLPVRVFRDYRAYDRYHINLNFYNADMAAVIMFTSGTTSAPKGALISNYNLDSAVNAYHKVLKLDSEDVTVLGVPVFHITGLVAILALFIDIGGTTYLEPRFKADKILRLVDRYGVTFIHGSPTVFSLLSAELIKNNTQKSFDSVRSVASGAGRLNKGTISALKMLFPKASVHTIYGLTESTSPLTIYKYDISLTDNCDSSGWPVAGAHVQIRDENNHILPVNHVGTIWIRGPMVIKQYFPKTKENAKLFDGAYLNTGDVGLVNENGELFVKDRIKDIIDRGGEKIFCPEIESLISTYPGVIEVALIAKNDQIYGEVPVAFIKSDHVHKVELHSLQKFLLTFVPKYQIPIDIIMVDDFPRTGNGKINKRSLRSELKLNSAT